MIKKHFHPFLAILIVILLSMLNTIQAQQLTCIFNMSPMPSPYPYEWQQNPSIAQLTITNLSGHDIDYTIDMLVAQIEGGNIVFKARSKQTASAVPAITMLTNIDVVDLNEASISPPNAEESIYRSGRLPQGRYSVTISITEKNFPKYDLPTQEFEIIYPAQAQLLTPLNNEIINNSYPVFTWSPVNVPPGMDVNYNLKIVDYGAVKKTGVSLIRAFDEVESFYETTLTNNTTLIYPADALPLENYTPGSGSENIFAWRVRALDANGAPITVNDGKSEPFLFTYQPLAPVIQYGDLMISEVFPNNNETIQRGQTPQISFSVSPAINPSFVRSGTLKIWEFDGEVVDESIKNTTPDFVKTNSSSTGLSVSDFDENISNIRVLPTFIFGLKLKPEKKYAWTFELAVNTEKIRRDQTNTMSDNYNTGLHYFNYTSLGEDLTISSIQTNEAQQEVNSKTIESQRLTGICRFDSDINISAITSFTIKFWQMSEDNQDAAALISTPPTIREQISLQKLSLGDGGSTNEILFETENLNLSDQNWYLWNIELNVDGNKIRADELRVKTSNYSSTNSPKIFVNIPFAADLILTSFQKDESNTSVDNKIIYMNELKASCAVNTKINPDAVKEYNLMIWEVTDEQQIRDEVIKNAPKIVKKISKDKVNASFENENTLFDFNVENLQLKDKQWYIWNIELTVDPNNIREDGNKVKNQNYRSFNSPAFLFEAPTDLLVEADVPDSQKTVLSGVFLDSLAYKISPKIKSEGLLKSKLNFWKVSDAQLISLSGETPGNTPEFSLTVEPEDFSVEDLRSNVSTILIQTPGLSSRVSGNLKPEIGENIIWELELAVDPNTVCENGKQTTGPKFNSDAADARYVSLKHDSLEIFVQSPGMQELFESRQMPEFVTVIAPAIKPRFVNPQLRIKNLSDTSAASVKEFVFTKEKGLKLVYTKVNYKKGILKLELNPDSLKSKIQIKDSVKIEWAIDFLVDSAEVREDRVRTKLTKYSTELGNFTFYLEGIAKDSIALAQIKPELNEKVSVAYLPKFSLSIKPAININGLLGGKLNVWPLAQAGDTFEKVKNTKPVYSLNLINSNTRKFMAVDSMQSVLQFVLDSAAYVNAVKPAANKRFVWNVELSVNPASIRRDKNKTKLNKYISGSREYIYNTEEQLAEGCKDNCSCPMPVDITPASLAISPGDTISVGKFKMILSDVNGSGDGLTGNGTIKIPLFNTKIEVEFEDIKVNKSHQMFEGEVKAKIDPSSGLSGNDANDATEGKTMEMEQIKKAHSFASQVGRLIKGFSGTENMMLPIALDKSVGGRTLSVGIMGAVFRPTNAGLNIAMSYELPELGENIGVGFGARNVCFSPTGLGGNGVVEIYLAKNLGFSNDNWGINLLAPSESDTGTYVAFDCRGFKDLRLAVEVQFPRAWLKPFPEDDGVSKVKATFSTHIAKGKNWIAAASMDRSEIAGVDGFVLEVKDMAFDNSIVANQKGMVFPKDYVGAKDATWTGFYIKRASISLPDALRPFGSEQPPQVSFNNVLINKSGITGDLRAENVITYPNANFGSWGGSIDTLSLQFLNSTFKLGQLKGRIKTPISDDSFVYTGRITKGTQPAKKLSYSFVVKPPKQMKADLWMANLNLDTNSVISLTYQNSKFLASAKFNGSLNIKAEIGGKENAEIPGLKFENFGFNSSKPYFTKGTWSFASPPKTVAGFPFAIKEIDFVDKTSGGKDLSGIKFKAEVNLTPNISGSTELIVWGELSTGGNIPKFKFNSVELNEISVNSDVGAVSVKGSLNFYKNHNVYGSGFRGTVDATFLKRINVSSTLQFGKVQDFRYFFIDAKGIFNPGVPFGQTGVGWYGLGGGFWYNMSKSGTASVPTSNSVAGTAIGSTASGFTFTPKKNEYGFMATVVLGTYPLAATFNCDLTLSAEIKNQNNNLSIYKISLSGNGFFLADITQRHLAKITGNLNISYDLSKDILHGEINAVINASPLTGKGKAEFHVESGNYYVNIGTETNPISMKILNVNSTGYFQFNKQGSTTSINFGAGISYSTGRVEIAPLVYDISGDGKIKISLSNKYSDCGLNGWYGTGTASLNLSAYAGIFVNESAYVYKPCGPWYCYVCKWCRTNTYLYNYKGEFEIFKASTKANLTVYGPVQMALTGNLKFDYSILGGLVDGTFDKSFSVGTKCSSFKN